MIPMTAAEVATALGAAVPGGCGETCVRRVVTDSREVRPGDLFFAIPGERFDGHDFVASAFAGGAIAAVVSREVPPASAGSDHSQSNTLIRVPRTVDALGNLARYYRKKVMKPETIVIGVTGSSGKTTTKCMIDHVLARSFPGRASAKSFNNHLGVPLTILTAEASDKYLVVEIGMNARGEIAALSEIAIPHVAVITSIGEAHVGNLGSVEAIAAEKTALLDYVTPGGMALVNVDRPEVGRYLYPRTGVRIRTFGRKDRADLRITRLQGDLSGTRFTVEDRFDLELRIPGLHHATNAAAAFAVARWMGVAPEEISDRLRTFLAPQGRTCVQRIGPARVVDDSYNANPASVSAAIATLAADTSASRVFVLGDMLELGEEGPSYHRRAIQELQDAGIETIVVTGPLATEAAALVSGSSRPEILVCETRDDVAAALIPKVKLGATIWVKGSRGMKLDEVVGRLVSAFNPPAAVA